MNVNFKRTMLKLTAVLAFIIFSMSILNAQPNRGCIAIAPRSLSFPGSGGLKTVTIYITGYGCEWHYLSGPSWVRYLGPPSASINTIFDVYCTTNSGAQRSGYIIFEDVTGIQSKLYVSQEEGACNSAPVISDIRSTSPISPHTKVTLYVNEGPPSVNSPDYYSWGFPPDCQVISGGGTRMITVILGSSPGFVSVTAYNECDVTTKRITY